MQDENPYVSPTVSSFTPPGTEFAGEPPEVSIMDILYSSFDFVRRRWRAILGTLCIIWIPLELMRYYWIPLELIGDYFNLPLLDLFWFGIPNYMRVVFEVSLGMLCYGSIIALAHNFAGGKAVTVRSALGNSAMNGAVLLAMRLMGMLVIALGLVFFIIPGIYIALCLLILESVVVVEECYGVKAIKRCIQLSRGRINICFGMAVVVFLPLYLFHNALRDGWVRVKELGILEMEYINMLVYSGFILCRNFALFFPAVFFYFLYRSLAVGCSPAGSVFQSVPPISQPDLPPVSSSSPLNN